LPAQKQRKDKNRKGLSSQGGVRVGAATIPRIDRRRETQFRLRKRTSSRKEDHPKKTVIGVNSRSGGKKGGYISYNVSKGPSNYVQMHSEFWLGKKRSTSRLPKAEAKKQNENSEFAHELASFAS